MPLKDERDIVLVTVFILAGVLLWITNALFGAE
jgi:hypothetical protein